MKKHFSIRGFTLIDILISVAIISFLSSVVLFNVSEGKVKAEDAKKKTESAQVATAIELYKSDKNSVPGNTNSILVQEGSPEYVSAMEELVTGGYLSKIPSSPDGASYFYMTNDEGTEALFAAKLKTQNSTCRTTSEQTFNTSGDTSYCQNLVSNAAGGGSEAVSCGQAPYITLMGSESYVGTIFNRVVYITDPENQTVLVKPGSFQVQGNSVAGCTLGNNSGSPFMIYCPLSQGEDPAAAYAEVSFDYYTAGCESQTQNTGIMRFEYGSWCSGPICTVDP